MQFDYRNPFHCLPLTDQFAITCNYFKKYDTWESIDAGMDG